MSAPESSALPDEALLELPVFPLPGLVFFPGTLLPLHIFEPRYRAMIRHCLATHRTMAVTLALPGPLDAHQHPPISLVAGAGVILEHEELPDGRFNILLRGQARVQLSELPFLPPYRRAQASVIADEGPSASARDMAAVVALASTFAAEVRAQNPAFDFRLPELPPEQLVHVIASSLVIDPQARQQILEDRSPQGRCARVLGELAAQRSSRPSRAGSSSLN